MKKLIVLVLTLVTATAGEIISWDANSADEFVTAYRVYYSHDPRAPLPWTLLVTTSGTSATNSSPQKCAYYVTAVNVAGESAPSDIAAQKPGKPAGAAVAKQ